MPSVLITGTSSGIGRVTTEVLAQRGWRVFATMRDPAKQGPLRDALSRAGSLSQVTIERLDVTDPDSVRAGLEAILARTGNALDAVVHNAGIAVAGTLEDVPESEMRRVMETNFFGVLDLTRQLLPIFRAQRKGRILLVSSDAAFAGQPSNSIYCASKWALEGWAESVAYELAPFGVEVILVEPGPTKTEIWHSSPRIMPAGSPYRRWMQLLNVAADKHVAASASDARAVGVTIARALEARRPRFRYPVGAYAHTIHFMRGKVPASVLRRFVSWYMGLNRLTPAHGNA